MEHKKANEILMALLDKNMLNGEEREAVIAAIGALDCASLADKKLKGFIESKKAKRMKDSKP